MPSNTIKLTFITPNGASQTITANENQSIMQAAKAHNISGIEGVCGGCIACATCHIYIPPEWQSRVIAQDNEQSEEETDMLDLAANHKQNSRLGCQIKLTKKLNGLTVEIAG